MSNDLREPCIFCDNNSTSYGGHECIFDRSQFVWVCVEIGYGPENCAKQEYVSQVPRISGSDRGKRFRLTRVPRRRHSQGKQDAENVKKNLPMLLIV